MITLTVGIRGVRPDNLKVLCATGPKTKYFERLLLSFNKLLNYLFYNLKNVSVHQVLQHIVKILNQGSPNYFKRPLYKI